MPNCYRIGSRSRHHARQLVAVAAVLVAAISLPSSASAQSTSASYSGVKFLTEVPLLDCKGTPCIEVRIGDDATPLKFVIDTGNVESVVDTKLINSAAPPPHARRRPDGNDPDAKPHAAHWLHDHDASLRVRHGPHRHDQPESNARRRRLPCLHSLQKPHHPARFRRQQIPHL